MPPGAANALTLLVHADEGLVRSIRAGLADHGARITHATSTCAALEVAALRDFDAILLDLQPLARGLRDVLRDLRKRSDAPIIVIAEDAEQAEQAVTSAGGADDYVTKPCSPRDMLVRVRVVIGRERDHRQTSPRQIQVGSLVIQEETRRALVAGKPVALTTTEFDLLSALASRPARVLSRERLLRLVRGRHERAFDRLIDVQVSRLRQKLAAYPESATMIRTVRCGGYTLVEAS